MKAQHVRARRILSLCCIAAGVILLLYPQIREWAGRYEVESQAEAYQGRMAQETDGRLREMWDSAERYNRELSRGAAVLTDPFLSEVRQQEQEYESLLAAGGDGLMGFVEIGTIDVYLPIYHGTDEETLEKGAGHLEGSSLPVGGAGTHTVLSGHTGLRTAKLFTDLDQLKEGDVFCLHILDQVLAYQVREIAVVEPSDVGRLRVRPGLDLCTLITCTPYGVNSHRLLITGERTDLPDDGGMTEERDGTREMEGRDRWKGRLILATGLLLGLALILYPLFSQFCFQKQSEHLLAGQAQEFGTVAEDSGQRESTAEKTEAFYREAAAYNASLADQGQAGIGDPGQGEKLPLLTAAAEECGLGYVEIPAMKICLPLFFGASEEHLAKGAALLEGTSLPLGEETGHAVAAAHRGYRGLPFFRDIELLEVGDPVYVTTLWGSYPYRVREIQIIEPSETEALRIRPGEDLLTLLTCHPYLSGGTYRYAVCCQREQGSGGESLQTAETGSDGLPAQKEASLSEKRIAGEKILRLSGVCGIGVLLIRTLRPRGGCRRRRKPQGRFWGHEKRGEVKYETQIYKRAAGNPAGLQRALRRRRADGAGRRGKRRAAVRKRADPGRSG